MSIAMPVAEPTAAVAVAVAEAPRPASTIHRSWQQPSRPQDSPRTAAAQHTAAGRLCDPSVSENDRGYALAMHLSCLAGVVLAPLYLAPLVIWLIRRRESVFNDDHGREVINFMISFAIYAIVLSWTIVVPVILMVVGLISVIRGAVAANNREYFRYPLTIRFL